jgi:hypothetical protein
MLGMTHREFGSIAQRAENYWKIFPQEQVADYGRADGMVFYGWMAKCAVLFLDAYLKHDAAAQAFLKKSPAENGVPQHFLWVMDRPAQGPAP